MKCSMTGHEKGDLLIELTTWAVVTVYDYFILMCWRIKYNQLKSDVKFNNRDNTDKYQYKK